MADDAAYRRGVVEEPLQHSVRITVHNLLVDWLMMLRTLVKRQALQKSLAFFDKGRVGSLSVDELQVGAASVRARSEIRTRLGPRDYDEIRSARLERD